MVDIKSSLRLSESKIENPVFPLSPDSGGNRTITVSSLRLNVVEGMECTAFRKEKAPFLPPIYANPAKEP